MLRKLLMICISLWLGFVIVLPSHAQIDEHVRSITWSPDGQYVATSVDEELRFYDAQFQEITRIAAGSKMAWSPDSTRIVISRRIPDIVGGVIEIRPISDLDTIVLRLGFQTAYSGEMDWSPDGTRLVISGPAIEELDPPIDNRTIRNLTEEALLIVDAMTGEILHELSPGPLNQPSSVTWSPDGRYIAASEVSAIILWDAWTGEMAKILEALPRVSNLAWSDDGRLLAQTKSFGVVIWDVDTEQIVQNLGPTALQGVSSLNFADDIIVAESFDADGQFLYMWRASTGELLEEREIDSSEYFFSLGLSPDGRQLIVGTTEGIFDPTPILTPLATPQPPIGNESP